AEGRRAHDQEDDAEVDVLHDRLRASGVELGCNDLRRSPDPVVADVARDRGHRDRRDDRDDRYHRKQLDEAEAGLCWRTAIPSCTHGATSSCKAHSAPRSTVLTSNYATF